MKGILPGEVPLSDSEISTVVKSHTPAYPLSKSACENTKIENLTASRPPLKKLAAFDLDDGGNILLLLRF